MDKHRLYVSLALTILTRPENNPCILYFVIFNCPNNLPYKWSYLLKLLVVHDVTKDEVIILITMTFRASRDPYRIERRDTDRRSRSHHVRNVILLVVFTVIMAALTCLFAYLFDQLGGNDRAYTSDHKVNLLVRLTGAYATIIVAPD